MKHIDKTTLLILGTLLLASCAKEKEYKEEYKAEVASMSTFPCAEKIEDAPKMLYVPMTLGTPREVADANPFYQGDEKMVKCVFTKEGIEVIELEKDSRFSDNSLNNTPVLLIPGEYKKYVCHEDEYGDCTNKEEEKTDLEWNQKNMFKPDYASLEVKEVNMLDLTNIEGSDCVQPQGVKVVSATTKGDGVLNIELEKTYKLNKSWKCIRHNYFQDKLSYNSFKVRFFYSMVAVDKVSSPDYKKVEYPIVNHSKFGFFKDKVSKLDNVYDSQREEDTYLINRWNPNKKVIRYHLSPSYSEPKNKPILDATMRTLDAMNYSLKQAGVGFQLEFIEQPDAAKAVSPGDIRYNSLVLIDDPLANGLLGYAPTVKNPQTGEIVQGHVNMYGGVLTSTVRWTYASAVDVMEEQYAIKMGDKKVKVEYDKSVYSSSSVPASLRQYKGYKAPAPADEPAPAPTTPSTDGQSLGTPFAGQVSTLEDFADLFVSDDTAIVTAANLEAANIAAQKQFESSFDNKAYFDQVMSGNFEGMSELDKRVAMQEADELGYKLDSKNVPEFFPIAGTVKVVYPSLIAIPGITDARGVLKKWEKLTDAQREKVKEIIVVNGYISTLVHEMGHSLGLRHNFAGSTDAANFYTQAEAKALGLKGIPAYSSVMDYAGNTFNKLGVYGKYDIAALRYSYTGTLATKDGTAVKIPSTEDIGQFRDANNEQIKTVVKQAAQKAGLPNWDYERIIAFLKDNVIDNDQYSQEIRDYFRSVYDLDKKLIPDYKYCTDENAGLSATCNRFDEGTNLYEIAKGRVLRYKNYYKYRNFRDGRLHFKSTDLDQYAIGRYREFGKIRDIMELYDLYSKFVGQENVTKEDCKPEDVEGNIVCELNMAVKVVADMFLDIIKTPDLTCAVGDAAADKKLAKVKELVKMKDIMEDQEISKILRQEVHFLTSCFDPIVKDYFKKKNLTVIGEVGKFLNSHRDSDPNYKYADDIYVRGIWVDKMMAMRFLFERRHQIGTTDETQLALIDHPYVKKEFNNIMKHMIEGKKLANPLPFVTEAGEHFTMPYILETDVETKQIEDNLGWLKRYFKMEQVGSGNLLKTLLVQIDNAYIGVQGDAKEKQYTTENYVTVRKWDGYLPEQNRMPGMLFFYDLGNGVRKEATYAASKVNSVAYEILTLVNKMDELKKIDKKSFKKIIAHKIKPATPAGYDEADAGFFDLTKAQQEVVISLESRVDIPIEAFENFAGDKVVAKKMFDAYTKMHKVGSADFLKKIVKVKQDLIAHGPADATAEEKMLLGYTLDFLEDFVSGKYTDEVVEYYAEQLSKLPGFME